jgi:hypothetical protein
MGQALFAWEGFSFTHHEDWAPVALTGSRTEGYARLQGPGATGIQVRWRKTSSSTDLEKALDRYVELLARDAKKAKAPLEVERRMEDGRLVYRWTAAAQGRGALFDGNDGRIFFLEVIGRKGDSLLPHARSLLDSFANSEREGLELWSLLGLSARLPAGLSPAAKSLQSGRTWLSFRMKSGTLEVCRYAFGTELSRRHGLEGWARSALRLPRARAEVGPDRVELFQERRLASPRTKALVRLDAENNRLLAIRLASNRPKWEPQWRWLD